ncbi:MAG: rod shape-determining protein RodA [Candidatus Falkowbacteria bacterium]
MYYQIKLYLKNFDWIIFSAVLLLSVFGLMEVYSVALGLGSHDLVNFYKQAFFVGLGIILMFIFTFIDYRFLKSLSRYLYWFGAFILISVLVFGQTINGTKGWFNVFGFGIQPVEFIKIILIIFLASYFSNLATKVKTLRHFIFSALSTILLAALIILQPDFGSALVLLAVWFVMIIMAGFNKRYFIAIFLIAIVLSGTAWLTFKDYQKQRITTFLNPSLESCSQKECYNSFQAIIAVGSGGVTGKGVGFGSQSQLKFLPEAQTDFIFSVVSEELGFLGVGLILSFFGIFYFRSLSALKKINNDFGIYFILGLLGLILTHMFVNIGMNIGLLPIVGLPLPFISYGGSATLSLFMAVGIMENIIIKSKINY